MLILGLILIVVGALLGISILYTIGIILAAIGLILLLVNLVGHRGPRLY